MSKTKNKLTDLNNLLFEQLERLNDETLKGEALQEEISRANSVTRISQSIISNASLILDAAKFADERIDLNNRTAELLIGDVKDD